MAALFPYLKKGGHYIIEDLHTSFFYSLDKRMWIDLFQKYGISRDFTNTTYLMLDNYLKFGEIKSEYMSDVEVNYLNRMIKSVVIDRREVTKGHISCTCDIIKSQRARRRK
jgi:hypothetical protein